MKATQKEIDKALLRLAELLVRIANITRGMDEAVLQVRRDGKTWSINDILAHLRSCADVWGQTIESMLSETNPTLPEVHPHQWLRGTNYRELGFRKSWVEYSQQRERLLETLKELSIDDWSRAGSIAGRMHTVFFQVRRMAKHENGHCEQIEELLNSGGAEVR